MLIRIDHLNEELKEILTWSVANLNTSLGGVILVQERLHPKLPPSPIAYWGGDDFYHFSPDRSEDPKVYVKYSSLIKRKNELNQDTPIGLQWAIYFWQHPQSHYQVNHKYLKMSAGSQYLGCPTQ
jgi:hypothetical protein